MPARGPAPGGGCSGAGSNSPFPSGRTPHYRRSVSDVVLPLVGPREAGERPVLGFTCYPELRPFSTGTGDLNLVCGGCRFVLVAGSTGSAERPAMLIRCPSCGCYNDPVPAAS